jgi:predicted PurR-regulated permease PerM
MEPYPLEPHRSPTLSDGAARAPDIRPTLWTYLALMTAGLGLLLALVSPFVVSLTTGAILAALCSPLYNRLRKRIPTRLAALLVTLGVVLLIVGPAVALASAVVSQASTAASQLSEGDTPTLVELVATGRTWVPLLDTIGTPEVLLTHLRAGLGGLAEAARGVVLHRIRAFPLVAVQLVMVVLATYFSLVDGAALFHWCGDKLPLTREIRDRLARSFHRATNAVVLASLAAAGAQATLIFISFRVLSVPNALLAAGLTFVLGWVPALPTVVWGGAAIYLAVARGPGAALAMVGFGVAVSVIDNIVRPLVLRGQEEMNPMVSLLAIVGGIALLGVPGVFVGPVVACMAIAVLDIWPSVARDCGVSVSGDDGALPTPLPRT